MSPPVIPFGQASNSIIPQKSPQNILRKKGCCERIARTVPTNCGSSRQARNTSRDVCFSFAGSGRKTHGKARLALYGAVFGADSCSLYPTAFLFLTRLFFYDFPHILSLAKLLLLILTNNQQESFVRILANMAAGDQATPRRIAGDPTVSQIPLKRGKAL